MFNRQIQSNCITLGSSASQHHGHLAVNQCYNTMGNDPKIPWLSTWSHIVEISYSDRHLYRVQRKLFGNFYTITDMSQQHEKHQQFASHRYYMTQVSPRTVQPKNDQLLSMEKIKQWTSKEMKVFRLACLLERTSGYSSDWDSVVSDQQSWLHHPKMMPNSSSKLSISSILALSCPPISWSCW